MIVDLPRIASIAAPTVAAVVLAGMLARACDRARVAEDEVGRQREAALLIEQKFNVATQDAAKLRDAQEKLLAQDATLRSEFERLRKAAPGSKVVSVREGAIAPSQARGQPVQAIPQPAGCPSASLCLVPSGALLMATVAGIDVRTDKGNLVAITHVVVDRISPLPRTTILNETLEASAGSFVAGPPPERKPNLAVSAGPWWRNPGWTTEVRGGLRIYRDGWLDAAVRFDNQYSIGVRWEFR